MSLSLTCRFLLDSNEDKADEKPQITLSIVQMVPQRLKIRDCVLNFLQNTKKPQKYEFCSTCYRRADMGNTLGYGGGNASIVSLSTAKEHISDEEYRRIRQAFDRFKKDAISYEEFCIYVLGGAPIPEAQRKLLYDFCCGGADQLPFENLLCALVGLCKIEAVQTGFIESHREFSTWGLQPPLLTLPMKDDYISFYEVMAYVTHLTVGEVIELEKVFATISDRQVCKISLESWEQSLFGCYPADFSKRLFSILDENNDGFIDFRELVCGVSALCRAPEPSRLSFLAKLWDLDRDGYLSETEIDLLYQDLAVENEDRTISKSVNGKAAPVEVATWALGNQYLSDHIAMAEEIGHICLGLKPVERKIELRTVRSFLQRTKTLEVPERNVVSSLWFRHWEVAVSADKNVPPIDNSLLKGSKEDDGWSGKVACISSESSSLKVGLAQSEYIAVPPPLWKAWLRWHGTSMPVDSQFTRKFLAGEYFDDGKPGLELYPLEVLLVGHDKKKKDPDGVQQLAPWACAQVSRSMSLNELLELCKVQLRLTDNECRLWLCTRDNEDSFTLLDEESIKLHDLKLSNRKINKFLLEVRDVGTGIWPEELRASVTGTQIKSISNNLSARPGAVGIVNGGNFCYRNAAVQCLARVTPLTEFLLKDENISTISKHVVNDDRSVTAALEYASLLKELWAGQKKNISPVGFNNAVRAASDIFECGEQHDCQEFVAFLIEMLHSCMPKVENGINKLSIEASGAVKSDSETENDDLKADKEWSNYLERENSLVTSLFAGQLRSLLTCRACNTSSSVFEPFTSLSLPIGFDNTDLFQVVVIRMDGSIPYRYGFLVSRDATVGQFRGLIADATKLTGTRMTLQCLQKRRLDSSNSCNELEDGQKLCEFSPGSRLYAMEIPQNGTAWRLAAHRKLQYNYQPYLLGATGGCVTSRFGLPLILSCPENVSGRELYESVMAQMQRFMVAPPPAFSNRASDPCEVSSSGYPFTLSVVDKNWQWCGQCDSLRFCRGCSIRPTDSLAYLPPDCSIAVDWLPTALYLKYNHSQELLLIDDASVAETLRRYAAPSSLEECLNKFSCAENLDELLFCEKCKRKTNRSKSMSVWRLPKYLIVHFKRFEYLQAERRMGKCKRVIDFPLNHFDMSQFVSRPSGEKYDCIAIASHYGELSSGHFLAYARGKEEKWLLLNDCSVREVVEEEVDKAAAYLLFYERRTSS